MGISIFPPSTGGAQDRTVSYATPGTFTFTPPAGTSASNPLLCEVTLIGAGGGGGNFNSGSGVSGQGGGAGQAVLQESMYVTGPTTVVVGAGGAAQTNGGNSSFGALVALGGVGGTSSTSQTTQLSGTNACTRGAAGTSALRVLAINRESAVSTGSIFWKSPSTLDTPDGATTISKPPLTNPTGNWSVASNGSHIVACQTFANSATGGNNSAFYSDGTGWVIRSFSTFANAQPTVTQIGTTVLLIPGGQANTNTYFYATTGNNTWTTATFPNLFTGAPDNNWQINLLSTREEIIITRNSLTAAVRTIDGINWTSLTLPNAVSQASTGTVTISKRAGTSNYVYYVRANIANGTTNQCYTSTDLVNWTMRTINSPSSNPNANGNGEGILMATPSWYWHKGSSSDSNQANWFFSGDGFNWNAYTWDNDFTSGTGSLASGSHLWTNNTWVAGSFANSSNGFRNLRYGNFFPTSNWSSNLGNNLSWGPIQPYSVAGISNATPTAFDGIQNFQPTGGSSGVPSAGGDGGNGGSLTVPVVKSSATGVAATVGQVPGAGGGGGGAGSPTGAAGANGLVSIQYYG